MQKVIYSSIMAHMGKTINDREISDLHKELYKIAPNNTHTDEIDIMIIDKLIHRFDFDRLTSRREISLT